MKHMSLNICLVSEKFDEVAVPLSYELCPLAEEGTLWDATVAYRLAPLAQRQTKRGYAHTHCTVQQLCTTEDRVPAALQAVREVWKQFKATQLLALSDPGHVATGAAAVAYDPAERLYLSHIQDTAPFATLADGTQAQVPNVAIECTAPLRRLQESVIAAMEPFHDNVAVGPEGIATFHSKFPPANDSSYLWTLNYLKNAALDKYDPHLSLGATNVQHAAKHVAVFVPSFVQWRDCRLVVAHMGSYCSCFDILESSDSH